MNATTVMLACLFWELVWGSPGLFLAMPLMAAVKAICYHVPELAAVGQPDGHAGRPGRRAAAPDEPPDVTQVVPPVVDGAKTEKVPDDKVTS